MEIEPWVVMWYSSIKGWSQFAELKKKKKLYKGNEEPCEFLTLSKTVDGSDFWLTGFQSHDLSNCEQPISWRNRKAFIFSGDWKFTSCQCHVQETRKWNWLRRNGILSLPCQSQWHEPVAHVFELMYVEKGRWHITSSVPPSLSSICSPWSSTSGDPLFDRRGLGGSLWMTQRWVVCGQDY